MNYQYLKFHVEDGVGIITINNPPANILNMNTISEIQQVLKTICDDDQIKVAIITGAGKMFIAGADIKEIQQIASSEGGYELATKGQGVFQAIEDMRKPVIAAINGACLGGGMELAMACHIRIASEKAKLGQPEINLGIIPGFGGTQRLTKLTNRGIAMEWILTGNLYSSREAYQIGVISHVVEHEKVLEEAMKIAKNIASKGRVAVAHAMEAISEGTHTTTAKGYLKEAELFGEVCATEDKNEGTSAFLEKRPAKFKDR